jgi:predicted nucleic acid-binding protein
MPCADRGDCRLSVLVKHSPHRRSLNYIGAKYNVRVPDAIQIAAALETDAAAFLTNDNELKRVDEIPILTLADLAGEHQ